MAESDPKISLAWLSEQVAKDEATVAAGNSARRRLWVNRLGRAVDFFPTVLDPTTLLEGAALVAKAAKAVPKRYIAKMGAVGRFVTKLGRFDPVPDVPADDVVYNFLIEAASQVVPSWYRTAKPQIEIDKKRVEDAQQAMTRLGRAALTGEMRAVQGWRTSMDAKQPQVPPAAIEQNALSQP